MVARLGGLRRGRPRRRPSEGRQQPGRARDGTLGLAMVGVDGAWRPAAVRFSSGGLWFVPPCQAALCLAPWPMPAADGPTCGKSQVDRREQPRGPGNDNVWMIRSRARLAVGPLGIQSRGPASTPGSTFIISPGPPGVWRIPKSVRRGHTLHIYIVAVARGVIFGTFYNHFLRGFFYIDRMSVPCALWLCHAHMSPGSS
jgi:hypothetical protein